MHYDKATFHFSYAKFEASVGMKDEEMGYGALNTSLLCESMVCSPQYRTGIKQYFHIIN